MNFKKSMLVALAALPKRYVRDGLAACEIGTQGCVVAIHSKLSPICWYPKLKKWRRIKFKAEPAIVAPITGLETIGKRTFLFTTKTIHATEA